MVSAIHPVLDDNTTLPGLIDFHLKYNPDLPFALFPSPSSTEDVSAITFLEFGRACHRFARAALSIAQPGEVVGLIANADTLLYITAIAGFVYGGITVFPISPRNSPAAVIHMLRKVSSHRVMITSVHTESLIVGLEDEIAHAADGYKLTFVELPSLPAIYPSLAHERAEDSFTPLPTSTCDASPSNMLLYLHSSGSTGFPKPIPYTREVFANQRYTPMNTDLGGDPRNIIFGTMALPSFHSMGVYSQLFYPLFTGRPSAIFAPQYPHPPIVSSPGVALDAMKKTGTTVVFVVPTFLEIWAQDPDAVAFLKALHLAVYAGGPLAIGFGDALAAAGVHIGTLYGGTEFGVPTRIWPAADRRLEDWAWLMMADRTRPRWIDVGDGQYELQLLTCETHKLCVEDLPDVCGYETKDVWVPHPTRAGLWRIVGRADDVLMLANGEKTVPGPMECVITSSALVMGAVMFGRERNQVGVLLEPAHAHAIDPANEVALARFRNAIWPKVDEANKVAPAFSRIYKEMILVSSPGKPLPRAPKGTIQRKLALLDYELEIQAIYDAVENSIKDDAVSPPSEWTIPEISHWLAQLCALVRDGRSIDPDVDLFEQGFDSLSVTFLRNRIARGLRTVAAATAVVPTPHVHDGLIYANPKITLLAWALHGMIHAGATGTAGHSRTQAIADMIAKYAVNMPMVAPAPADARRPDHIVVLLTGSTGGLGSQMLAACLADAQVAKVYAMNRPAAGVSARVRHDATFEDRGLDAGLLDSPKLVFVEGDASKDWLGLGQALYDEIRAAVTVIVHNAWRLDFNLALGSFEPHVRGTRRLLDLAMATPHAAHTRVLFTSSIAVTQAWPQERGAVPEEPLDDAAWAVGNGYGEGKYVCEQLLVKAAERGLQTTSFRIGQITGSAPAGAWATTDWLPILMKSCLALGCLPDAQGVASWLPFDAVARAIIDVALTEARPERALNLVHPRPVAWRTLFAAFADALASGGARFPLVPWAEWQARLEARAVDASEEVVKDIPAIKLLPFFAAQAAGDAAVRAAGSATSEAAGLPTLATAKVQAASAALRGLRPLGRADVERWVAYWRAKGFLPPVPVGKAEKAGWGCVVG